MERPATEPSLPTFPRGGDLPLPHEGAAGANLSFRNREDIRGFAIGDVRASSVKRVAAAVGEGSVWVQLIHRVLAE